MGFFSRWLKKSPVSVAQKFSESPVNISQVAQLPIDWFGAGVYEREAAVRTVIELIEPKLAGTVDTTEHAAMACPQNNKPTPYNPTLPLT